MATQRGDSVWVLQIGTRTTLYADKEKAVSIYDACFKYYNSHQPTNNDAFRYTIANETKNNFQVCVDIIAFHTLSRSTKQFKMKLFKCVIE